MSALKGKTETLTRQTETTTYSNPKAGVKKMSSGQQAQGRLGPSTRKRPVGIAQELRSQSAFEIPMPPELTLPSKGQGDEIEAVPEVPSDEFENVRPAQQHANEPQDEEEIPTEEEEKSRPRVIPQAMITGGLANCKSTASPNLAGLAKARRVPKKSELLEENEPLEEQKRTQKIAASKTWCDLDHLSKDSVPATRPSSNVVLKDSKSPDPFEATHEQSEAQLIGLISSTSSPDSPLYHLRQSGTQKAAGQRAYRHFVISLFESLWYVKQMPKVSEELAVKQRVVLRKPEGLACMSTRRLDSQQDPGARPR